MNGIEKMIEIVASEFAKVMKEENFESFKDMADCYWWDSSDIRAEVEWYINNECKEYGYIFDDGSEIMTWDETESASYRSFVARVKNMADRIVLGEEEV